MTATWRYPLDPECPAVMHHNEVVRYESMLGLGHEVLDDVQASFETMHRAKCARCQEYGAANVEVR